MPAPITFTLDLEDHHGDYAPGGRWVNNAARMLDLCAGWGLTGTFFCVGRAAAAPGLMRRIAAEGHELALHSYDHNPLGAEDPARYASLLEDARNRLEDTAGVAIKGFRAPQFSLTPATHWAVEVLAGLGFSYSSSIIAGRGAFHGYPGKPLTPFKWENSHARDLWEFPVPVLRVGGAAVPFLGGVYLKGLPLALVRAFEKTLPAEAVLWTYLHPYDIDAEEGFVRLRDGTPLWANALLMAGRTGFAAKIGRLLAGRAGAPLINRIPA